MILQTLRSKNLLQAPRWLVDQTQYLTQMGSVAYGVAGSDSDVDIYGFCMPPKDVVFPYSVGGEILDFGTPGERFQQWQQHHIKPQDREIEYDITVFGISRYFHLCMQCNPNMIDSIFTPRRCILHTTPIGELVRENRKLFLHKGAWHTFKGYAFAQMHKIKGKVNASNPARAETIAKYGYDIKFAYHVVRLMAEVEQIMVEHDLDLEKNREELKAVRRGEFTLEQIEKKFADKEAALEAVYSASTLRHRPDEAAIKEVLLTCLEMHFGTLDGAVTQDISAARLVRDIQGVLARYSAGPDAPTDFWGRLRRFLRGG
jgi:predicted nucleotidyltransferase